MTETTSPITKEQGFSSRVLGISGRSGSGKTTLIEAMLPVFEQAGWSVNIVKHSHHDIELDPPGKDSARFRGAGAREVIISSPYRFSISRELRGAPEPSLAELIDRLSPADLTIVEGYHSENLPRIEVYRPSRGIEPQYPTLQSMIAVVSDEVDAAATCGLPVWPLNDPATVAHQIMQWFQTTIQDQA
ncbi:molybdopterin-guanine dinucleotide biosynthesis protein B [Orrella daihaiensis]|uniref:Molybdopterin-guanine dinucleotide biosynthesis protein B n=1 Tax=Orrella daihaiensis TaxID=2782176 RepID=A0ABY4APJ4_9BURK|nr:molybdopterin-guanine dinucleotide biosynthesis protein B [Orrella daihaiensis]UOD50980.1 molybdopterin-guanine dinucleotide biosynthesis protein B [Orrella daihaiensis]